MVVLTNLRVQRYKKLSNQQNILALFLKIFTKRMPKVFQKQLRIGHFRHLGGQKSSRKKLNLEEKELCENEKRPQKEAFFSL